jgi:hypothetical protein
MIALVKWTFPIISNIWNRTDGDFLHQGQDTIANHFRGKSPFSEFVSRKSSNSWCLFMECALFTDSCAWCLICPNVYLGIVFEGRMLTIQVLPVRNSFRPAPLLEQHNANNWKRSSSLDPLMAPLTAMSGAIMWLSGAEGPILIWPVQIMFNSNLRGDRAKSNARIKTGNSK